MSAGLKTLQLIGEPGFFDRLGSATERLTQGLQAAADAAGVPFNTNHLGGMFGFFFSDESPVRYFRQVTRCDGDRFKSFFHGMLKAGVYMAPSAFEAGFVSIAHSEQDIDLTVDAARDVLSRAVT
jgi:glutamate-1-semialdehyde 2,1-aminomutase